MQYLFNANDDLNQYRTKELMVKLFTSNPSKKYKNQDEIIGELSQMFNIKRGQSAVSKALKELCDCEFTYKSSRYVITHFEEHYVLVDASDYAEYRQVTLLDQKPFKRDMVFYEKGVKCPQTFVFRVKDDKIEEVKEDLKRIVGEENYFDIFNYDDKIVVLLNPKSTQLGAKSDLLKNFFSPFRK